MREVILIVFLIISTLSSVKCKIANAGDDVKTKSIATTTTPTSEEYQDDRNDIDVISIMRDCNETFRIKMSYLEQLNNSGSFPDETDRTPKCYIRCVLETSEVVTEDGLFDPRAAARVLFQVTGGFDTDAITEMALNCIERDEKCKCERSYQFVKCIMEKGIEQTENTK